MTDSHDAGNGDSLYSDRLTRERAIRYSRTRERLVLIGMVWSALTSLLALVSGSSARLRDRVAPLAPRRLGPTVPYALVATLVSFVASLPLSFYGGYVVEHRFQLSNHTVKSWSIEQLKGIAVGLTLGMPLIRVVYWIIDRYPRRWWAILSALTVPFSVILINLAPVLILPLFNTYEPLKDRDLVERIKALAARQGIAVSDVLQMNMSKQTKKPNAFFTGLGNTKRIVLADTLLTEFSPDEIEVVLAHELAHQVHRDLWKAIGLGTLTTVITTFSVHRLAPALIERFGRRWGLQTERGVADIAALPLLSLLAGGVSLVLSPLTNAYTRNRVEAAADRYALDLTGRRAAFITAMEKLGRLSLADPKPSALVKHFLYDHPPLQERIDFGRSYPLRSEESHQ